MIDIIGFTLVEAKRQLEASGVKVKHVQVTAPPRLMGQEYHDYFRVVRVEQVGDKEVNLLICDANLS